MSDKYVSYICAPISTCLTLVACAVSLWHEYRRKRDEFNYYQRRYTRLWFKIQPISSLVLAILNIVLVPFAFGKREGLLQTELWVVSILQVLYLVGCLTLGNKVLY